MNEGFFNILILEIWKKEINFNYQNRTDAKKNKFIEIIKIS